MQMVLHNSNSENKLDKDTFILRNTIPKVLKRKHERQHDKLTEILMLPGEACFIFFLQENNSNWNGGHLIKSPAQNRVNWCLIRLFRAFSNQVFLKFQ